MIKPTEKRSVDMQVIAEWVEDGSRILDLGCGRGVLLEYLQQTRRVYGVGVDLDLAKVTACVRRGVTAYQGDMADFLRAFPDGFFDRVICSRTVEELEAPGRIIAEALRVGQRLTVGFINHAYWKNRIEFLLRGGKLVNEVYPTSWEETRPSNPVSIRDFELFCDKHKIRIHRRVFLAGNWRSPLSIFANALAGYALYDLGNGATRRNDE